MATQPPRPRVLYIAHRVPYPPDKGDRIRNWHVLKSLATVAEVSLATLAEEPVPEATVAKLNTLSTDLWIEPITTIGKLRNAAMSAATGNSLSEGVFANSALKGRMRNAHERAPFAAGVISASSLMPYIRKLPNLPVMVDVVDVDSQKWFDYAKSTSVPKRWLYAFEGRRVRSLERTIASSAFGVTLVSAAETAMFNEIVGRAVATTATNGVDLDYFRPTSTPEDNAVTFVGAMDYLPNVDACEWFAQQIWPSIRSKSSTAEFRIIGRNPTARVAALGKIPGVNVVGGVPDVRPHLARAAVIVAPLRIARGLQNKVLEALAAGKAVVAGPPALAALGTLPGRDLLRAESPVEWAECVLGLLASPERRSALGQAGRAYAELHHDWGNCLKPLTDMVLNACRRGVSV